MRISDWSSDVCSSDLRRTRSRTPRARGHRPRSLGARNRKASARGQSRRCGCECRVARSWRAERRYCRARTSVGRSYRPPRQDQRSEEHTSELQSLMRISYAVFCLKKKKKTHKNLIVNVKNVVLTAIIESRVTNRNTN